MRLPPLGPVLLVTGIALAFAFVALVPRWRAPGPGADTGHAGSGMVQFAPTAAEARAAAPPPPKLPPWPTTHGPPPRRSGTCRSRET